MIKEKEIRWKEKSLQYGPTIYLGYVGRILAFKVVKKLSGQGFYLRIFLTSSKISIHFIKVETAKNKAKEILENFINRLELDEEE